MPCQALQTGICGRHESVRRGRPCSGPGRSGVRELVGPDSGRPGARGRPGRRTCGGTGKDLPPERRRQCRLGCGTQTAACRRVVRAAGGAPAAACRDSSKAMAVGCRGRRGLAGHPRDDVGVFPPLQPERRQPGAEPLQAAAKRHDGAGQLRPVRMPRPDAAAEAHPGDGVAERAADRCGQRPAPSPAAGPAGRATRMAARSGASAAASLRSRMKRMTSARR